MSSSDAHIDYMSSLSPEDLDRIEQENWESAMEEFIEEMMGGPGRPFNYEEDTK